MSRIAKRKVSWTASTATDVSKYRVYWNQASVGAPTYATTTYAEVSAPATSLTIPDQAPTFPVVSDSYILGVTALDSSGNESDMALTGTIPFDFTPPAAPTNVTVATI